MDKSPDSAAPSLFDDTTKTLNQNNVTSPALAASMHEMRIDFTMKLLTVIATALIAAALPLRVKRRPPYKKFA
jgi:hypothetical protein